MIECLTAPSAFLWPRHGCKPVSRSTTTMSPPSKATQPDGELTGHRWGSQLTRGHPNFRLAQEGPVPRCCARVSPDRAQTAPMSSASRTHARHKADAAPLATLLRRSRSCSASFEGALLLCASHEDPETRRRLYHSPRASRSAPSAPRTLRRGSEPSRGRRPLVSARLALAAP